MLKKISMLLLGLSCMMGEQFKYNIVNNDPGDLTVWLRAILPGYIKKDKVTPNTNLGYYVLRNDSFNKSKQMIVPGGNQGDDDDPYPAYKWGNQYIPYMQVTQTVRGFGITKYTYNVKLEKNDEGYVINVGIEVWRN